MLLDASEDLGSVDLAEHDVLAAHASHRVRHAPAVAVEHGQGVEVDVPVVHTRLPSEHGGVQPQVPVGHLDALRAGRGAACVVDGGGGVLVWGPWSRFDPLEEQRVRLVAGQQAVLHLYVTQVGFQLWVHEKNFGSRVVHDVLDLFGVEAEVDRHPDPSEGTRSIEEHQHSCRVVADHGHPRSDVEAHGVQARGHGPCQLGGPCVGEVGECRGNLVGLVDDGDPVSVDDLGPTQVVGNGQRDFHGAASCRVLAMY